MIIDSTTYEENPLLQGIRKSRGTVRTNDEGVATPPVDVQNELRSSGPANSKSSQTTRDGSDQPARSNATSGSTFGVAEGRNRGEGRPSPAIDQDNGRADGRDRSANGSLPDTKLVRTLIALNTANPNISYSAAARQAGCSATTATNYLKQIRAGINDQTDIANKPEPEEKPAGLASQPHPKEQLIRQEQEQEQQAKASSSKKGKGAGVKGLFTLISSSREKNNSKESFRSKPLTEDEAENIKAPLIAALMDYFRYADETIYATHKAHNNVQIWSSIDEEEAEVLVNAWLSRAKRDAKSAAHIVQVVNSHDQLKVGIILAPRFYATFRTYVDGGGISVR